MKMKTKERRKKRLHIPPYLWPNEFEVDIECCGRNSMKATEIEIVERRNIQRKLIYSRTALILQLWQCAPDTHTHSVSTSSRRNSECNWLRRINSCERKCMSAAATVMIMMTMSFLMRHFQLMTSPSMGRSQMNNGTEFNIYWIIYKCTLLSLSLRLCFSSRFRCLYLSIT